MGDEKSLDYDPEFEALWAGTVPVHMPTHDCLPIPRLAELGDREPTEVELDHLRRCVLCQHAWETVIAEGEAEASSLGPHGRTAAPASTLAGPSGTTPKPAHRVIAIQFPLRAAAQSGKKVALCGTLDDGRSIEIFTGEADDTLSVRIYGTPLAGPAALRVSNQYAPVVWAFDTRGYGRIRLADLPGQSPDSLYESELALVLDEVGGQ